MYQINIAICMQVVFQLRNHLPSTFSVGHNLNIYASMIQFDVVWVDLYYSIVGYNLSTYDLIQHNMSWFIQLDINKLNTSIRIELQLLELSLSSDVLL